MMAEGRPAGGAPNKSGSHGEGTQIRCFRCGASGHIRRNCPQGSRGGRGGRSGRGVGRRGQGRPDWDCGLAGAGRARGGHSCSQPPALVRTESGRGRTPVPTERGLEPSLPQEHALEQGALKPQAQPPGCHAPFLDTHCHLEYVLERFRHDGSFATFREKLLYPDNFDGCIASFCDPAGLSGSLSLRDSLLQEDKVWAAFGLHPHHARHYSEGLETRLLHCLGHAKCVALGEVGLDFASHCPSLPSQQHSALHRQLALATAFEKPVLLHCREAEEELLAALTSSPLPPHWPLHLHCYTGSAAMATRFLTSFPNLYIGFTGKVTNKHSHSIQQVARETPLDRLLIETDAPYCVPRNDAGSQRSKYSHPAMAYHVAEELSRLRSMPLPELVRATRNNASRLYGV